MLCVLVATALAGGSAEAPIGGVPTARFISRVTVHTQPGRAQVREPKAILRWTHRLDTPPWVPDARALAQGGIQRPPEEIPFRGVWSLAGAPTLEGVLRFTPGLSEVGGRPVRDGPLAVSVDGVELLQSPWTRPGSWR